MSRRSCSQHARTRPNITVRFGWQADRLPGGRRRRHGRGGIPAAARGDLARAISRRLRRRPQLRAPLAGAALQRLRLARLAALWRPAERDLFPRADALPRSSRPPARLELLGGPSRRAAAPSSRSTTTRSSWRSPRRPTMARRRPTRRMAHDRSARRRRRTAGQRSSAIGRGPRASRWWPSASRRPRGAGRRRRASVHADRRLRHEHRHGRRLESRLEARRAGAGLGRRRTCCNPTRSSASRSRTATPPRPAS